MAKTKITENDVKKLTLKIYNNLAVYGVEIQIISEPAVKKALEDIFEIVPAEPAIEFVKPRRKPLAELTAADIPPGLDPEDCATDSEPTNPGC